MASRKNIPLSCDRLRKLLHYDPTTGIFTWRVNRRGTIRSGMETACWRDRDGYLIIKVDHRKYRAHRLAWFYTTGDWPKDQIDHRDGITDNNRWENLRECDAFENHQNKKRLSSNKSGYVGVCWERQTRKWKASITAFGKAKTLGRFDNPESAHSAYLQAKACLHTFQPTLRAAFGGLKNR